MSDVVAKIKDLQEKRQKAQTAVTKLTTQLESFAEQKEELESKLQGEFGITFEEAAAHLEKLETKQAELLAEAEEKLSKIGL